MVLKNFYTLSKSSEMTLEWVLASKTTLYLATSQQYKKQNRKVNA